MRSEEADGSDPEGRATTAVSSLERIALALGVSVDTFYGPQVDRETPRPARSPEEQRRALLMAFDGLIDTAARERCIRSVEAESASATGARDR